MKEQIGDRIKEVLVKKDWRQADLVKATGLTKSYVSLVLSGQKNLTLETIETIEKALETKIIRVF